MATTSLELPVRCERVTDVTRIGRCAGCRRTRRLTWAYMVQTPKGRVIASVPLCGLCGPIMHNATRLPEGA